MVYQSVTRTAGICLQIPYTYLVSYTTSDRKELRLDHAICSGDGELKDELSAGCHPLSLCLAVGGTSKEFIK